MYGLKERCIDLLVIMILKDAHSLINRLYILVFCFVTQL